VKIEITAHISIQRMLTALGVYIQHSVLTTKLTPRTRAGGGGWGVSEEEAGWQGWGRGGGVGGSNFLFLLLTELSDSLHLSLLCPLYDWWRVTAHNAGPVAQRLALQSRPDHQGTVKRKELHP
jgi:hypothetical protein